MDVKLNHSDLSALLAKETGMSLSKAELFTKTIFDIIIEGLEQDGVVKINGLGTFKLTDVASRSSINVNTGEKFEIKGHKKLAFTPADTLKECVNQPFAMFEPVEVDETYCDESDDDNSETIADDDNLMDAIPEQVSDTVTTEKSVVEESSVADITVEAGKEDGNTEEVMEQPQDEQVVSSLEQQPVVQQPERPEPVMVHVPKKDKKQPVVPVKKKKRRYMGVYAILLLLLFFALFYVAYKNDFCNKKSGDVLYVKTENMQPSLKKEVAPKEEPKSAESNVDVTIETAVPVLSQEVDVVTKEGTLNLFAEKENEPEEYKFVITEELASLDLKNITSADTALYDFVGVWVEHKVVAHETLTRIALKYYGDKKLWPYIVKYNSLTRPDDLRKGMTILVPKLKPID